MNQQKPSLGPAPVGVNAPPQPAPGPVVQPGPGVVLVPSDQISANLKRMVQQELDRIPAGKRGVMARLDVQTGRGVNVVIAYKTESGWHAGAWVGKSGWDSAGGVSLGKVWQ